MYDKFNRVLRLETTTNNVSFFKHHRKVEHRDGHESREITPPKDHLQPHRFARDPARRNRRYLEYLSALDDSPPAIATCIDDQPQNRQWPSPQGLQPTPLSRPLLRALRRPEFNIRGIRLADLAPFLRQISWPASPASFGACASSVSSRRSFMAIAITLPALADLPSPPLVESLNKALSRLLPMLPHDKICSGNVKT
ncbi:MAG: hypothetical protein IPH41_17460 [Sulfuritalea sp.]|nr:hypothetical protein [Sulfuritalea sp.]